jgi:hypothetical protein
VDNRPKIDFFTASHARATRRHADPHSARAGSESRLYLAPIYLVTHAVLAKKPDKLLPIIAQMLHFRAKELFLSLYILSPLLCFHTHSRFILHF